VQLQAWSGGCCLGRNTGATGSRWPWVQLERVLQLENVQQYMSSKGHMHGRDFGYVVEARTVQGWPAGVDIHVPAIHLM
jgi:hypothetical protein